MAKKFLEGLVFGAGFAISLVVISYLAAFLAMSSFSPQRFVPNASSHPEAGQEFGMEQPGPPFGELTVEDQIKKASVIALIRYEPETNGKHKAVFSEFLKKQPAAKFYYKLGDEYPSASYYTGSETNYGDGLVVFFVGSPAESRMSMSYANDRVRALGDMPMDLLRTKIRGSK